MSNATELLRRAYEALDRFAIYDDLRDEIEAYLAAEPEAEPFAWVGVMTKERELLEETLLFLDEFEYPTIVESIRTYLSANSDDTEEPVAEAFVLPLRGDEARRRVEIKWRGEPVAGLLYAHPPKQRKPMTEDAEDEAFNSASKYAAWLETENRMLREARKPMTDEEMRKGSGEWAHLHNIFEEGVRYAEKHHGIGGDDA